MVDEEFISGKIDTGYLDRLLGSPPNETKEDNAKTAAISAAVFAALDSASRASNGTASNNGTGTDAGVSSWKKTARGEGLM